MTSLDVRPTADVARCAAALAASAESLFDTLATLGQLFADRWASAQAAGGMVSADLSRLQPAVFDALDRQPTFDSAGFVLTEHTLTDTLRHLEWWHRADSGMYEPLLLNVDLDAPDCYDYYAMEWFVAAAERAARFVSGPLIDLPCADVYIMTFTSPIVVGGRLCGIAGADVAVARYESLIVPPLRRLGTPAVLVNRERRVIASNDAIWTTGEKLPSMPAVESGDWLDVVAVTDDLGWRLAVAA